MSDRSNAGERTLGARKTARGHKDALENIVGHALHDGAQCFVIEEQANYRFVAGSELPESDKYIVAPLGKRGRWIRESGLVGLALLEAGRLRHGPESGTFAEYKPQALAQFELLPDGGVRYIGTVPRVAFVAATASLGARALLYIGLINQGVVIAAAADANLVDQACTGVVQLMPGDTLVLRARLRDGLVSEGSSGSLRVVLV